MLDQYQCRVVGLSTDAAQMPLWSVNGSEKIGCVGVSQVQRGSVRLIFMSRFSILGWPVFRQAKSKDKLGRGPTVESPKYQNMRPRTEDADKVVQSVCPYCAVGCGQRIYVKDNKVTHIEGDPDSPISRGRLCPKGAASEQLVNTPSRQKTVLYRRPRASDWEEIDLDTAMDMIADRFLEARENHWEDYDEQGRFVNRTMGIAALGGATIDNEENYLIKKLFSAAGAVQIENQARI
jgi:formate dehydrogenase major subunit